VFSQSSAAHAKRKIHKIHKRDPSPLNPLNGGGTCLALFSLSFAVAKVGVVCMDTQAEGLPASSRGLRSEASAERRYPRKKRKGLDPEGVAELRERHQAMNVNPSAFDECSIWGMEQ